MKHSKFAVVLLILLAAILGSYQLTAQTLLHKPIAAALLSSSSKPTYFVDLGAGIPPTMTFTRASGRSCVDATLKIVQLGTNVPCFYVDPATGTPWGYLAEMQSTNLVTQSQDLSNAYWNGGQNITRTANAVTSPDGTQNASTITEDNTTNRHECDTAVGGVFTPAASSVYGLSFFIKNTSGSRWLVVSNSGSANAIVFQASSGTLGTTLGSQFSNVSARSVGNGWYRVSALWTAPDTTAPRLYMSMQRTQTGAGTESYTGDGTSALAIWGIQWETAGVGVTSYIATAGSTVTRSQDILTWPLSSLPGWNGSKGGVVVAKGVRLHTNEPSQPGNNQPVLAIDDGTLNNGIVMLAEFGGAGTFGGFFSSGGTTRSITAGTAAAPFVRRTQAIGWDVSRQVVAYDGNILASGAQTVALPASPTTLRIGSYNSGGPLLNGTLESIAYYAGARSDAFVQAVSRPRRRRSFRDRIRSRGARRAFGLRRAA